MFLKRHVIHKDGKEHVYYSLCESVRLSAQRVVQRRLLSLGELNTTQVERWQRSIEVIQQEGGSRQYRLISFPELFTTERSAFARDRGKPEAKAEPIFRPRLTLP